MNALQIEACLNIVETASNNCFNLTQRLTRDLKASA